MTADAADGADGADDVADGGSPPEVDGEAVTPGAVREALEEVDDPEIPISVVDLGLIYDVTVDDGAVAVEMTFTSLGCPAEDMLREAVEGRIREMPGVGSVTTEIVWSPPWTVEQMSEAGRERLREFGITSL